MPASANELMDSAASEMAKPVVENATEVVKDTAKDAVTDAAAPKASSNQEADVVKPADDTKIAKRKHKKRKHHRKHSIEELQKPVVSPVTQ